MGRTGALLPLSREHHTSLVMARTARRAADDSSNAVCLAALADMETHWHTLMAEHCKREEQLIRIAAETLNSESVARILTEHAELHMLTCGPCLLEPTIRLRRFADLVVSHVRYEERVIFPQLQSHPSIASVDTLNPINSKR